MIPQLWDIKECSERLRIPVGTLRNWVSQKRIPYVKLGGRCLFSEIDLRRWIEDSTIKEESNLTDLSHSLIKKRSTNRKSL